MAADVASSDIYLFEYYCNWYAVIVRACLYVCMYTRMFLQMDSEDAI